MTSFFNQAGKEISSRSQEEEMQLKKALQGFFTDRRAMGYSPATLRTYRSCLGVFQEYLGDENLEAVQTDTLVEFLRYLRTDYTPQRLNGSMEPLSPATLDNYWIALRSFFTWCHSELALENIADNIPRPEFDPPDITPLNKSEVQEAIRAATKVYKTHRSGNGTYPVKIPNAERNQAIILLLLDTGLRLGELARLRMKDLDLENGSLSLRPGGTDHSNEAREIPLGEKVRVEIRNYLETLDTLGPGQKLFSISKRGIQSMLYRVKKRTGNEKIHAHNLRHTFAVEFLKNGGEPHTLQEYLGHSSPNMVRRYQSYIKENGKST